MFNLRTQPPQDDNLPHLPLLRVGTRGVLQLAITCTTMLQLDTHFMNRRTLPCMAANCPGCAAELPRRYEAYISGWTAAPSRHVIVALTPRAAKQLWDSAPSRHDMRGTVITLQRTGNRANGPLTCRVDHTDAIASKLPPIPELYAHMLKIWGLTQSHFAQDHPYYATETAEENYSTGNEHGA